MASQPHARLPSGPQLRLVAKVGPRSPPLVTPPPVTPPVTPPTKPASDEEIVAAFQAGDVGSGARLYDRLFPVVDATLVRILGRRESDHSDLVQTTFEQIVSTLARRTFAGRCGLPGWAAVLACHVGLNALRSRRRERGVIDRARPLGEEGAPDRPGPAPLESQLHARDALETVRRHLAGMDPERVTALLLHAMGYDLAEIAELTSTSTAAAQSRLSRGRRELRARIDTETAGEPSDTAADQGRRR
jgi:RNA polymerase sigma-70 factor (ECF subfamily)